MGSPGKRMLFLCALGAFSIGVVWRAHFIFIAHPAKDYIYSDMQTYYTEAHRFGNPVIHQDIRDTIFPPGAAMLFRLALGPSDNWRNLSILQFLISIAIPILLALIAYILYDSILSGITLILSSLYIGFIEYAGFLLSENPYIFFQLVSFLFLICCLKSPTGKKRLFLGFLSGVTLGLTASIRTVVFIPALLVGIAVFVRFIHRPLRATALLYISILFGLLLIVLPLTIRCSTLSGGKPCIISTNGPLGILQGHYGNVSFFIFNDVSHGMLWTFQSSTTYQKGVTNQVEFPFGPYQTDAVLHAAYQWIIKHPGEAIRSSFVHIFDLYWGTVPWPPSHTQGKSRIIISEWIFRTLLLLPSFLYLGALFVIPSLRRKKSKIFADVLIFMPILGIMIIVFITIAEPRYRIPYDAFFMLLAARAYSKIITSKTAMD